VRGKNSWRSVPMTIHSVLTPSSRSMETTIGIISATPPPLAVEFTIQTVRPLRAGTSWLASVRRFWTMLERWAIEA